MWSDILINILEDGAFAAMAAIGFSSISNTPHRAYMTCALIAAAGHSIRYMLTLPELGAMHIIPANTIPIAMVCNKPFFKFIILPSFYFFFLLSIFYFKYLFKIRQ